MLKNYLMMAFSVYRKRKVFTFINLMCIVLTLVVLLVVTAIMEHSFAPSGVDVNRDRIVQVDRFIKSSEMKSGSSMVMMSGLGYKLIDQYLKPIKSAEKVSAVTRSFPVAVYQDERVEKLTMVFTDAVFWEIYRYQLKEGNFFSRGDVDQGRFHIILNTMIAQRLFGDQAAVGKKLNVRGHQYEVTAVVDDGRGSGGEAKMWAPLTTMPSGIYSESLIGDFYAVLMAKTTADVSVLKKEISEIGKTIKDTDPAKWPTTMLIANTQFDSFARGFSNNIRQEDSGAERVFGSILVMMFMFMLLPALNLVNLNLGRMIERSAEIGVRKAFGASRLELLSQFLVENIVLSLIGCLISFAFTRGFLVWLNHIGLMPDLKLGINFPVFGYGVLVTIVFGIVSGVIPAWRMARLDPVFALKGNA